MTRPPPDDPDARPLPRRLEEFSTTIPAALGSRFRVEREIGRGGMAVVFLAHDRKHDRPVAVKVLRPEIASSLGSERFLREIHTAARLQHPHILPLHDSGDVDGSLYYVMPYVEGESLRDRLRREPQLPLEEVLRLTREMAEALDYAHGRDVVHRDIKPENILLSGGHALIMDFGIARAISSAGADALTRDGLAIGTPAYMPPEQASGERAIDGRADIYSLGCVVYEMLAGHPPFLGTSAQQILARHSLDQVPPLRTIRPDLPASVDLAVRKALAKSPADRFPRAGAFADACVQKVSARPGSSRRYAVLGVTLAILLAGGALIARPWRSPVTPPAGSGGSPSVAVLALRNVGGDPENEPFSDGISEEISTTLARVGGLAVKAPRSAFSFKGKGITLHEIGRQLGVRYLVDGSVQRSGDRLRVRVELVHAENDSTAWTGEFDRPSGDVFAIQDEIARAIAAELRVHLTAPAAIARRTTGSTVAHELYLQGRYFFEKRDSVSLRKAREYFEQAIAADSSYALAYAGLSDALAHTAVFGFAIPRENMPRAKALALRALALDSTLAEAHSSLGFIAQFYEWDFPAAGRAFESALRLDSNHTSARLWRAWHLLSLDSTSAAIEEGRRALALDPFSPIVNTRLVTFLYLAGQYDGAVQQANRAYELDSTFFQIKVERARALALLDRCPEALEGLTATPPQAAAQLAGARGFILARCDQPALALAELEHLRAQVRAGRRVSHYGIAAIEAALGQSENALADLERAFIGREWAMFIIKVDPVFESLRGDGRFVRLMKRVGI